MNSNPRDKVPRSRNAVEPAAERRARFDRWLALEVPSAAIDDALEKFRAHAPPLDHRDLVCLAILEVEGSRLRRLIPDDRPHEDAFALARAVLAMQEARFPDVAPEVLHGKFARWVHEVLALRDAAMSRALDGREARVLRLYDETVVAGRVDPRGLEREIRWAVTSAERRAGGRARRAARVTGDEIRTGLHVLVEIALEGTSPWWGLRKGRYMADKRALRDRLRPDYRPVAPPFSRPDDDDARVARPDGSGGKLLRLDVPTAPDGAPLKEKLVKLPGDVCRVVSDRSSEGRTSTREASTNPEREEAHAVTEPSRLAARERIGGLLRILSTREAEMVTLSLELEIETEEWATREHHRRLADARFGISWPGLLKMCRRIASKARAAV